MGMEGVSKGYIYNLEEVTERLNRNTDNVVTFVNELKVLDAEKKNH